MKKYLITVNGNSYEVEVEEMSSQNAGIVANPVVEKIAAPVEAKKVIETPKPQAVAIPADGTAVKAPMPGTIVKINVEIGSQVKKGDTILVFEAMKMENDLKASIDGKITSINTTKGSQINTGDVLITIA